jgi:hypothetical protein
MVLKLKHINLQEYPNHKGISHIGPVVRDNAVVDDERNPLVLEEVIKKGQLFESLGVVKFFFRIMLYGTINHSMWQNQIKTYDTS